MTQPNRKQRRANNKNRGKNNNQIRNIEHKPTGDKFAQFASRANKFGVVSPERNIEPFIIGEECGVTPPISINPPTIETRDKLVNLTAMTDFYAAARVLFGADYDRLLKVLAEWEATNEEGVTGEVVLVGIFIEAMEHFFGQGAASPFFSG